MLDKSYGLITQFEDASPPFVPPVKPALCTSGLLLVSTI
jgi:hypothetical protein